MLGRVVLALRPFSSVPSHYARMFFASQFVDLGRVAKHAKYAHIRMQRAPVVDRDKEFKGLVPQIKRSAWNVEDLTSEQKNVNKESATLSNHSNQEVTEGNGAEVRANGFTTNPADESLEKFGVDPPGKIRVPVYSIKGKICGSMLLDARVFGLPLRKDILQRCVEYHRAKRRKKTFKAKDRSEVRGSGKKVRNQKGSGRARAGDRRPPHWRGGGVAHGPVVRSFAFKLNKKVLALGIKTALSARLAEGKLRIIDKKSVESMQPKTKPVANLLRRLGISKLIYIGYLAVSENLKHAVGNLRVDVHNYISVTTYDILRSHDVFLSEEAITALETRLVSRVTSPLDRKTFKKREIQAQRMAMHCANWLKWSQAGGMGENAGGPYKMVEKLLASVKVQPPNEVEIPAVSAKEIAQKRL